MGLGMSERTDVVICGGGPTGMMLSAYLGRAGVHNIVLERDACINTDPRGIALDEDGIRLLQGLGLYEKVFTEIGRCFGKFNFIGGTHHDLSRKPFLAMDYDTSEGGTGNPGAMSHKQPTIEKCLREAAALTGIAELRSQSTVTDIREDADLVFIQYADAHGKPHEIQAKFMVGADGKTGFTRKHYLEAKGVKMEQASQMGYEEIWVALNWKMTLPTKDTHPHFPLWKLGYSPEEVYDAFFPLQFRFLCNPERPAVCGRFGPPEDRLWRFEFVVQKNEDGYEMAKHEQIKRIVFPYVTHHGKRYSLPNDVQYPEDCIEILRSRPFKFSARSCNKWAVGRVMLVGDAAHVFPPFGGQGIASGFRDASALSWRLALACRPSFTGNYTTLLSAWYAERKQQLEKSLRATVVNGAYCTERNSFKIFIRDWHLWLIQLIPAFKRKVEMGPRAEGMSVYEYVSGEQMPFLSALGGGRNMPQVYCRSLGDATGESKHANGGKVMFTDDLIYSMDKTGLMQIVVLLDNVDGIAEAIHALKSIDKVSNGSVLASEATFIIHDFNAKIEKDCTHLTSPERLVRIATGDEFGADPVLCRNRPQPRYYDAFRMKRDLKGAKYVILRPDRFVFAACYTKEELAEAAGQARKVLELGKIDGIAESRARL